MLSEINRLLEEAGAVRLAPGAPVWELAAPWWPFSRRARRFERTRTELLERALSLPGPIQLVSDENPQEYDVGGPWARSAERTWPIPANCRAADLLEALLEPGGWCIYASREPLDALEIPDAFGVAPEQVAEFALARAIPFLAQAFHDNDPWRLFVEDVTRLQAAAA